MMCYIIDPHVHQPRGLQSDVVNVTISFVILCMCNYVDQDGYRLALFPG